MNEILLIVVFLAVAYWWRQLFALDKESATTSEKNKVPWVSTIAMTYPLAAMVAISSQGAPPLIAFGYGVSNLGYVLFVAGIFGGAFRVLNFYRRSSTLIASVSVFMIGVIFTNL